MPEAIAIDGHRQLFLDDCRIEDCPGIDRRGRPVRKHPDNPVIVPRQAWEPRGYVGCGAFFLDPEDGLYKGWCSCHGAPRCEDRASPTLAGGLSGQLFAFWVD